MVPAPVNPYRDALVPAYVAYCQTVSPRHMAMSIESCTYLWWLCDQVKARTVCDLGSGFTSYTLRAYAALADYPVSVTSVDDSVEWLDRTREFLTDAGMPTDGLVPWDEWSENPDGPYDVIVHDLASGDLRNQSMWTATDALADGGMILFDDAQNHGHINEMFKVAEAHGMKIADIRDATTDEVKRFSLLAVPA
jgi:predicted O-methyltransferase YrrM